MILCKKKTFIVYVLLIVYILFIPFTINYLNKYYSIINSTFWLILFLITKVLYKKYKKFHFSENKVNTTLILSILYSVIFFFGGLLFEYGKSPYSHLFLGVVKNLWIYIVVVIFKEYIRSFLVNYNRNKFINFLFIVILFTILDLNYYNFFDNFINELETFKYLFSVLLVSLCKNVLLVYLSYNGGIKLTLSYLLPIVLVQLFLPILPKYNWFILTLLDLIFIIVVYFVVNLINNRYTFSKKQTNKNYFSFIFFLTITIIISLFIVGVFRYMPVVIMSNSMSKVIMRGDIVVVEKNTNKINVNDIIQYQLNNTYIIHRVVDIKTSNNQFFLITKGDNNQLPDSKLVSMDQVVGVVKFKIPKLGYPSVILNEFLKG